MPREVIELLNEWDAELLDQWLEEVALDDTAYEETRFWHDRGDAKRETYAPRKIQTQAAEVTSSQGAPQGPAWGLAT